MLYPTLPSIWIFRPRYRPAKETGNGIKTIPLLNFTPPFFKELFLSPLFREKDEGEVEKSESG
jgi:hypothetical protein